MIGQQKKEAGLPLAMGECLQNALELLSKATANWPEFTDSVYLEAKCHSLLGHGEEAIRKLEILSDRDRRYYVKAKQDRDFEALQSDIEALFRKATTEPGKLARSTQRRMDETSQALAWAKRSTPDSAEELEKIEFAEMELLHARNALQSLDVDIEGLHANLGCSWHELTGIARNALTSRIRVAESEINSVLLRKTACERSIEELRQKMKLTKGVGLGCLFMWLTFMACCAALTGLVLLAGPVITAWVDQHPVPKALERPLSIAFSFGVLGIAFIGYLVGSRISRNSKNKPFRDQIEESTHRIAECDVQLPPLRETFAELSKQMADFSNWFSQSSASMQSRTSADKQTTSTPVSTCSVVLTLAGPNKIEVIKAVRQITGLDLKKALELVEGAPQVVKEGIGTTEAEMIKKIFGKAGATVQIK